ncbi:22275_t:CDS:2 [Rhizophagus irregularis]|nr:22275_t:CDS:2 [Rhizophagus irregularis]
MSHIKLKDFNTNTKEEKEQAKKRVMELLGITVKNEQDIKISVQNLSGTVQEPETTHSETAEWKTAMPTNGGRRSDACTQSSFPTGREEEIDSKSGTLAIWELCGDQRMVTSSILQTRSTNQFPFNQDRNTGNDTTLQKLQVDYTEFSKDHLVNILKKDYSFHDETNINVLSDREINKFSKVYGITDVHPILSYDDFVFWLEDNNGIIYIWSRMENSIILGGHDLREALMNFLFYQENLRYIDEYTHKLVPLDVADREAKEWAESWEPEEPKEIEDELVEVPHNLSKRFA